MSRQVRLQYKPEQMARDIRQVRLGNMSQKRAASVYAVPRATLGDKVRGVVPETSSSGPKTILAAKEEATLAQFVKNMASAGLPLTRKDLLLEVKRLLDEDDRVTTFTDNLPGMILCKCLMKINKH